MEPQHFKHFINGEFVSSSRTFPKHHPSDGALIGQVCEAGKAEVNAWSGRDERELKVRGGYDARYRSAV